MSSFICSANHFNSIEYNLQQLLIYNNNFYFPYTLQKVFPDFQKQNGIYKKVQISKICDTLRELNVLTVSFQYRSHYEGTLNKEIETQKQILFQHKKEKPKILSELGLYNALRCLRYQLELEYVKDILGFTTEQEQAIIFLGEIIKAIGEYIINNLPEDKTNVWSID